MRHFHICKSINNATGKMIQNLTDGLCCALEFCGKVEGYLRTFTYI